MLSDELAEEVMLLINALYFKGNWRHQFPKNRTEIGGFYVSSTDVVNVPLMRTTDKFFYFESNDLDAKILRLPYKVISKLFLFQIGVNPLHFSGK